MDYTILEDETCCGSFLMRTGYEEDARRSNGGNTQTV